MQLSARILTALAVLAFVVGVFVGGQSASEDVSAATGTIDALNVGTCTTTNADVFKKDKCTQLDAFYQQTPLPDLIEVDTLYSTYAHDPKTAAEDPRAIIENGDLILVSITDKGRDRRDPVLITTDASVTDGAQTPFTNLTDDPLTTDIDESTIEVLKTGDTTADPPVVNAREVVGEALDLSDGGTGAEVTYPDLPDLEQQVEFDRQDAGAGTSNTTFENSGTYEIIWGNTNTTAPIDVFKPIAPDGDVKFFGRVTTDGTAGDFIDLEDYITLDEDVISGETDTPPAMVLQVSVPQVGTGTNNIELHLIYYETSGIEYIQGGDLCFEDPDDEPAPNTARAMEQAACTSNEIADEPNDAFVLNAISDEDAADDRRHLALVETGRFTGIFQGYLQLTDADGTGSGEIDDDRNQIGTADNWGIAKTSAVYVDGSKKSGTAVIGVQDGPVTITYKDTDGKNRTYDIEIDIGPPTISIDSPTHNSRSDDEKPSFLGTFNDSDSGLASNSFQLDVQNIDETGIGDTPIISVGSLVKGSGNVETAQVSRQSDYTGYSADNMQYGVISVVEGGDIYRTADDPPSGPNGEEEWKSLEADDFDDGAPDGEFNGEIEIDFDEKLPTTAAAGFEFNNAIDFQALVRDLAGNVGFSDSDPAKPRYIDALGEAKEQDRVKGNSDGEGERIHNVLGVFSKHVVHIDDKDPEIDMDKSVTGFYGLDSDDNLVRDRSAVMVVFDAPVNGDLIDNGTFSLEHDEETAIEITDVSSSGKLVFLKLGEELASDATPTLSMTEGREVEDLAGNILSWQEPSAEAFELEDGILPIFTVTLSGGSGTGVGSEGPSKLTKAAIDVSIDSDEDINGSPNVNVVCNNIKVDNSGVEDKDDYGLSNFVNNRTGNADGSDYEGLDWMCGGADEPSDFRHSASLARPGNNWVYAWRNASAELEGRHLNDGGLTVVVWGRDRNEYEAHDSDDMNQNWGSTTAKLVLDSTFHSPLNDSGGSVQPDDGDKVKEPRPFIYLDFAGEITTVDVTAFYVDGEDVRESLDSVGDNRFLYWPEALEYGTHKVKFDANDAADNKLEGVSFEFDVTARDPFVIDLTAGWNAISLPADPIDTALDAVFTNEAVDRVVGWNPLSSTGPWSIATRIDGVWTTSANFAPLTDVVVRYGYWVHSAAFTEQAVDLKGQIDRETGENPSAIGIATVPGWNFVGVVDQDGDQTEDNWGDCLQDNEDTVACDPNDPADGTFTSASEYMPGFRQAYTWDAIANGYRVLDGKAPMIIGQGIWVFFPDGNDIAP